MKTTHIHRGDACWACWQEALREGRRLGLLAAARNVERFKIESQCGCNGGFCETFGCGSLDKIGDDMKAEAARLKRGKAGK